MHKFNLAVHGVFGDGVDNESEEVGLEDLGELEGLADLVFVLERGAPHQHLVLLFFSMDLLSNDIDEAEALGYSLVIVCPKQALDNLHDFGLGDALAVFQRKELD